MDTRRTIGKVPGTSRSVDRRGPGNNRLTTVILVLCVGVSFGAVVAHAQDATWEVSVPPATSDWNTPGNWMSVPAGIVPTGTATFAGFGSPTITFSPGNTTVGALQFSPLATPYTFNLTGASFAIIGAGIFNNSPISPSFNVGLLATLSFEGASTAGDATIFNSGGGAWFSWAPAKQALPLSSPKIRPLSLRQEAPEAKPGCSPRMGGFSIFLI